MRRWTPALCLLNGACSMPVSVERTVVTMGAPLRVAVAASSRESADRAAERCVRAVLAADRRWSSWRADSLLQRLHRAAPGVAVPCDQEFCRGLLLARIWAERTGGAFDPGVGPLIETWRVREGGATDVPTPAAIRRALAVSGVDQFVVSGAASVALDHPGDAAVSRRAAAARIAAGGFAKGLALDTAIADARRVEGVERVELDFGGQLAWWSGDTSGPRRVGVAAPNRRDHAAAHLALPAAGSLATSGNSERGITVGGVRRSHILDPRTGYPAPAWGAVTVLVTDPERDAAAIADCLSTALYVLGPIEGLVLAQRLDGVEAVFIENGGRWHLTPGMRRLLPNAPKPLTPKARKTTHR